MAEGGLALQLPRRARLTRLTLHRGASAFRKTRFTHPSQLLPLTLFRETRAQPPLGWSGQASAWARCVCTRSCAREGLLASPEGLPFPALASASCRHASSSPSQSVALASVPRLLLERMRPSRRATPRPQRRSGPQSGGMRVRSGRVPKNRSPLRRSTSSTGTTKLSRSGWPGTCAFGTTKADSRRPSVPEGGEAPW